MSDPWDSSTPSPWKPIGSQLRMPPRPPTLPSARDELIDVNAGRKDSPPLYMTRSEIGTAGLVRVVNWRGERVWLMPICGHDEATWQYHDCTSPDVMVRIESQRLAGERCKKRVSGGYRRDG